MTEAAEQAGASSAISVSQALSIAKGALEGITVKVLGEISELSNKPGYKAVYFSIKDDRSTLPCMMWMNRYNASGVELSVGSLVELSGRFTLYAAKGRMNFDVFSLSLAGEGNLRLKVANLAKKLQAEGLMAPERKKRIAVFPERIGLVTSPRGAAVHDVLRTLRRRFPVAKVFLAGVPVEGEGAPQNIAEGLRLLDDKGLDVILLVRGGGSFEDLMPFNDEALAYAIANAKTPIVTGIGHEPDTSIADMVADIRASTPTAAAESISPALEETRMRLADQARRLRSSELRRISDLAKRLEVVGARGAFAEPDRLFADVAQTLDDLSSRLEHVLPDNLDKMGARLDLLERTFRLLLGSKVSSLKQGLEPYASRMCRASKVSLDPFKTKVSLVASRLEDLSPLQVLSRGYSIAKDSDGVVISSIDDVDIASRVDVVLSDGIMDCKVVGKQKVMITLEEFDVGQRNVV